MVFQQQCVEMPVFLQIQPLQRLGNVYFLKLYNPPPPFFSCFSLDSFRIVRTCIVQRFVNTFSVLLNKRK